MKTYQQAVQMLADQKEDLVANGFSGDIITEAATVAEIFCINLDVVLADVNRIIGE